MTSIRKVLAAALLAALVPSPGSSASLERPIPTRAPSWFTRELAQRAVDAGARGVPLPTGANVPASSLAFAGIRPGQAIVIADSSDLTRARRFALCTSNFVFTNGTATPGLLGSSTRTGPKANRRGGGGGEFSIGTAGHCGKVGSKVFMVFAPLGVVYIGDITKSTFSNNRLAPDFALIGIKPDLNTWVSPSMAHVGGPTGVYTANQITPVLHSGHGLVIGTGGTARAGVAFRWGEEWRFEGAITPGDSGSGAIVPGGLAAGNITHIAVDTRELPPAWMGGTSMTAIMGLVGGLQLATCSLPIPWPAPGCPPVGSP